MGGYVNLAIRKQGSIQKTLSYTGVIPHLYNPGIYLGEDAALKTLYDVYKDCPEQTDPGSRQLAPFHYGLIVIDLDNKTMLDMQQASSMRLMSAAQVSPAWEYVQKLGQLGWLGEGLYDMLTGELLTRYPADLFSHEGEQGRPGFTPWLQSSLKSLFDQEKKPAVEDVQHGVVYLPSFKIHPPGWTYQTFENHEGRQYQQALTDLGFVMTDNEQAIWSAWIEKHT